MLRSGDNPSFVPQPLANAAAGGGEEAGCGVRGQLGKETTAGRALAMLRLLANPCSQAHFKLVSNAAYFRNGLAPAVVRTVRRTSQAGAGA